ncbi:MAG: amino acid permease [Elusimicrobiales bacterium]|nr:amino acid permease [Elusimicrobiales bacterium]
MGKKFDTEVKLSREMSLMDVTLIGVGAMIGAGIFVLTGIAAGVAGPGLLLAFLLNGFVALLTAMSYAELGSCYHDAGGGYLWVKEGLPKWNGFLSGWMSWFAHAVACSLYALGFGAYFEHLLRAFGVEMPHWGFLSPDKIQAGTVALIFAYINFKGASETGKIGNLVTISKIAILGVFAAFGLEIILHQGGWLTSFTPFLPKGWSGVVKAMGLTFIAFQGFEVISQCSEEVKNPRKNIPKAIFLSLLIVIPIYLIIAFVAMGAIHPAGMTSWEYLAMYKEVALVEISKTFFYGGGVMLLFGGLISTISALNATIYSSSRVAFAMGRDRNFPTFFSNVHPKNFTPHWAILFSVVIVVVMAVSLPIEDVASAADIMFLLLFLQVNIALISLRKKRPDLDRGFTVPLFPWLTSIGIVMIVCLAAYMMTYSPIAWIITVVWVVLGLIAYKSYASKREVVHIQKVQALERLEKKEYKILVCLSKAEHIRGLSNVAMAIARKNNAEIIFLNVIEVKEGVPLKAGLGDVSSMQPLLNEAENYVESFGIEARTILDVSYRVSQGIVETAEEESCNFIILGRQKRPGFMHRLFSSVIDTVIQKSPCEVAVLHGNWPERKIGNILIPYDSSIHTRLAAEIAPGFMEFFSAEAQVAKIFEPDVIPAERQKAIHEMQEMLKSTALKAKLTTLDDKDVLESMVDLSKKADLMIMGGRTGDFLELFLGKSLAQEITEESFCPVLWVKEYQEVIPFWSALLTNSAAEKGELS